jgi:hypothetical protein
MKALSNRKRIIDFRDTVQKRKGFGYYLGAVGGLDNKDGRKSYIIYPNGNLRIVFYS